MTDYANVTFTGLQFQSGSATYGGCIAIENSDVRIVDTTFTSCSAVGENCTTTRNRGNTDKQLPWTNRRRRTAGGSLSSLVAKAAIQELKLT